MINIGAINLDRLESFVSVLISLLGTFRFTLGGNLVPTVLKSKREQLLVCLALNRQRRVARDEILITIWPQLDTMIAGQRLNSLTHQLNRLTGSFLDGDNLIIHDNGYYHLNNRNDVGIDIDYFDAWRKEGVQLLRSAEVKNGIDYCKQALALYRGDLCGDSDITTIIERERLRNAYLDLLTGLADHYYIHTTPAKALLYIRKLLSHDPCREDAHRQAMRCYMAMGLRAQALRQYRICCQALTIEFEAKPEPATVKLFEQIRLDPISV